MDILHNPINSNSLNLNINEVINDRDVKGNIVENLDTTNSKHPIIYKVFDIKFAITYCINLLYIYYES